MSLHYHGCPRCYERWICTAGCTVEPDLSEPGRPFSCTAPCDECEPFYFIDEIIRSLQFEARLRQRAALKRLGGPDPGWFPSWDYDWEPARYPSLRQDSPLPFANPLARARAVAILASWL